MKEKRKAVYKVIQEKTEFGIEYGIVCEENGNPYMSIKKISPNKNMVEEMAEKFNNYNLASIQFFDEVEDSIP